MRGDANERRCDLPMRGDANERRCERERWQRRRLLAGWRGWLARVVGGAWGGCRKVVARTHMVARRQLVHENPQQRRRTRQRRRRQGQRRLGPAVGRTEVERALQAFRRVRERTVGHPEAAVDAPSARHAMAVVELAHAAPVAVVHAELLLLGALGGAWAVLAVRAIPGRGQTGWYNCSQTRGGWQQAPSRRGGAGGGEGNQSRGGWRQHRASSLAQALRTDGRARAVGGWAHHPGKHWQIFTSICCRYHGIGNVKMPRPEQSPRWTLSSPSRWSCCANARFLALCSASVNCGSRRPGR